MLLNSKSDQQAELSSKYNYKHKQGRLATTHYANSMSKNIKHRLHINQVDGVDAESSDNTYRSVPLETKKKLNVPAEIVMRILDFVDTADLDFHSTMAELSFIGRNWAKEASAKLWKGIEYIFQ